MRLRRAYAIAGLAGLTLSLAVPASADLLTIPSMIPDICVFGHCIQFTQSTALASVQQVIGQIQQLKNEAQNLATLPRSYQDAEGDLNAILGTGKSIAKEIAANTAAQGISDQAEQDAAEAARLNGLANNANGAQQEAIATNSYLSQLNETAQKQLLLSSAQQTQSVTTMNDLVQAAHSLSLPYDGPEP